MASCCPKAAYTDIPVTVPEHRAGSLQTLAQYFLTFPSQLSKAEFRFKKGSRMGMEQTTRLSSRRKVSVPFTCAVPSGTYA